SCPFPSPTLFRSRRRGRLAVRAADGDRLAEAHQFGQHLGAANDRQEPFAGGLELGVGFLDRGRDDDDFGGAQILRPVADEALDALLAQALDIGAVGLVGPLHAVAEILQHLGDAAHADAADADEMHQADRLRHLHGRAPFLKSWIGIPDAIASARSASNRAASGFPADLAADAMDSSLSGWEMASPIRVARRSVDSVDCGCSSAPPAAASAAALAAWSWSSAWG